MSEREELIGLIRDEYDPRPNLGRGDYPAFDWDDGTERIADAILADRVLLLRKYAARIEALEAALRKCVQYHVEAAADCRAISAVNQDNCLGPDSLTAAIDHDIAAEDIGEIVRAALDKEC
jgi:hypothetical protein